MCGITGLLTPSASGEDLETAVRRMASALVHRGPDDEGAWVDPEVGIALGFRRLAILDLSTAGHQPMVSACGRHVIVFNGEVYNFAELRHELEPKGHCFRGHSDTEVMLAAIGQWGLQEAVKKFVGMFAFALWDRQERILHLVVDRVGIKPLYYGWARRSFLFGSELKALRAHPGFAAEINRGALSLQMRYSYIPQPHSIYRGTYKLRPGTMLSVKADSVPCSGPGSPVSYWSAREAAERGAAHPFRASEQEAADRLEELLREAVRLRLVSDVPLGAFLSGGIDSSTVVALMQALSSRPVKTFTVGFHETNYNEAVHAQAVAAHLGTDHTELYVTPEEARAVIPKLPAIYDEPFSDSSQIPTYLISQLARQQVTVSLSGDGGDELFAGYNRYFLGKKLWRWVSRMSAPVRNASAWFLRQVGSDRWDRVFGRAARSLPLPLRERLAGEKVQRLADMLAVRDPRTLYPGLVSHWRKACELVVGATELPVLLDDLSQYPELPDFARVMMFLDLVTYLPDDILVKVDRASMAVSLEARVPILDHRVVEFALSLPASMHIRNGQGKYLLRKVLDRYVPRRLIERPKMGFGVPIDAWLRGPLREWAEDLLGEDRLRREGFFRPQPIRSLWARHLSGRSSYHYYLWDVLSFQAWRACWHC
ncbi:MAG: asparagine synthase (glutamine-hydrolyzing) [Acidobacteria bacterium]|nr:MAG: asparagine synthase (glutamine-hydrolyzing) [Acidobacteriota bacterium]PYV27754.1 MAG: asparagine synthase (glutamine-hydrolyzing) [Acidobacteriota bacterium]